jgi:hypothetical protein
MPAARVDRLLAMLLVAACTCAGAAQIDTLFHSAAERARLDRIRRGEPVAAAESPAAPEVVHRKELTGYVKRSDGRGTAFIDGAPVPVDPRGAPLLEPGAVSAYSGRQSEDLKIQRKR